MENILWLIIIGSLFVFLMKKGGCCGGHTHGSHENHGGKQQIPVKTRRIVKGTCLRTGETNPPGNNPGLS